MANQLKPGYDLPGQDLYYQTELQSFLALKPELLRNAVMRRPEELKGLQKMMIFLGLMTFKKVGNTLIRHAEKDSILPSIGVAANVPAPGAGAAITFTVPAVDHSGGGTGIPLQPDDEVRYGSFVGFVDSVNPTTPNAFTVTLRARAGYAYGAMTAGTTRVAVMGNSVPENSTPRQSAQTDFLNVSYRLQQMRNDYTTSGRGKAGSLSEYDLGNGKKYWSAAAIDDEWERYQLGIDRQIITADPTVTTGDATNTRMTGLTPFILGNGILEPTGGNITLQNFRNVTLAMDREKHGMKEFYVGASLPNVHQMDDIVNNNYANGAITWGTSSGLSKELLNTAFSGFKIGGDYRFIYSQLDELTNINGLGTTGLPYGDYSYVIPLGKMTSGTAGPTPLAELVYLNGDGENRLSKMYKFGWGENGIDTLHCGWLCDIGGRWKQGKAFSILHP